MEPVHLQVLDAARGLARAATGWTFPIAAVVRALPALNPATVRTHVASRCCVNAPANHQSRHPYFRALGRGVYRLEPRFRAAARAATNPRGWQDRLLDELDAGIDTTLIDEALRVSPTERLQRMQRAAASLDAM